MFGACHEHKIVSFTEKGKKKPAAAVEEEEVVTPAASKTTAKASKTPAKLGKRGATTPIPTQPPAKKGRFSCRIILTLVRGVS